MVKETHYFQVREHQSSIRLSLKGICSLVSKIILSTNVTNSKKGSMLWVFVIWQIILPNMYMKVENKTFLLKNFKPTFITISFRFFFNRNTICLKA